MLKFFLKDEVVYRQEVMRTGIRALQLEAVI